MKIAVNTRLLLKNRLDGIGQFTYENLRRITQWHPEHHFFFIFDRPFDESFLFSDNITPVVAFPPARHPYLWYLFFEFGVPLKLKSIKPDLFISTDGWIPTKLDVPIVNVIHDLNFLHNPQFVPRTVNKYYTHFFPKFAHKATQIATVSEFSKQDIINQYGVAEQKIDVVYSGNNPKYKPLSVQEQSVVKEKYSSGCDFFLFVGLIHKRKNLDKIFKAFDIFKAKNHSKTKLIVVGEKKWWKGEIEDTYNNMFFKEEVIMLGYQPSEVVIELTSSARAVVYASLFEGFGLPIVDAFNAQVPVITSTTSAMPEIAGDAGILVNPYSEEEIAEAMSKITDDDDFRNQKIEQGILRKDLFTWDRTAELFWKTIEKVF